MYCLFTGAIIKYLNIFREFQLINLFYGALLNRLLHIYAKYSTFYTFG